MRYITAILLEIAAADKRMKQQQKIAQFYLWKIVQFDFKMAPFFHWVPFAVPTKTTTKNYPFPHPRKSARTASQIVNFERKYQASRMYFLYERKSARCDEVAILPE